MAQPQFCPSDKRQPPGHHQEELNKAEATESMGKLDGATAIGKAKKTMAARYKSQDNLARRLMMSSVGDSSWEATAIRTRPGSVQERFEVAVALDQQARILGNLALTGGWGQKQASDRWGQAEEGNRGGGQPKERQKLASFLASLK